MKFTSFFLTVFLALPAFAKDCDLNQLAASSMAELYVLKNESEIRKWVEFKDLGAFAQEVASRGEYSDEHDKHYFEIVTYPNNGGSWHSSAWLEVSCLGVHLNSQLVDQN